MGLERAKRRKVPRRGAGGGRGPRRLRDLLGDHAGGEPEAPGATVAFFALRVRCLEVLVVFFGRLRQIVLFS